MKLKATNNFIDSLQSVFLKLRNYAVVLVVFFVFFALVFLLGLREFQRIQLQNSFFEFSIDSFRNNRMNVFDSTLELIARIVICPLMLSADFAVLVVGTFFVLNYFCFQKHTASKVESIQSVKIEMKSVIPYSPMFDFNAVHLLA